MRRILKALVASGVAGAGVVTTAASAGALDSGQWIAAGLVALTAGLAVWRVPNAPEPEHLRGLDPGGR